MAVGASYLDPDNGVVGQTGRPLRVRSVGEDHSARPETVVVVEVEGKGGPVSTLEADVNVIGLSRRQV